jgi:hypothetical protein
MLNLLHPSRALPKQAQMEKLLQMLLLLLLLALLLLLLLQLLLLALLLLVLLSGSTQPWSKTGCVHSPTAPLAHSQGYWD